jgi:hypothetical protein
VDSISGVITFTPETGFTGDPTPISYTVQDRTGLTSNPATVSVNYPETQTAPNTLDDFTIENSGPSVRVSVLNNDSDPENDLNPATLQIVGTSEPGASLIVAGEGIWTVDLVFGELIFTPEPGFSDLADPTPIEYTVRDKTGLISEPALVVIDYLQPLRNSISLNQNTSGFTVIDSSSKFFEEEKIQALDTGFGQDYNSPAQDLIMYQPIRHYELILWGSLRNQIVLEEQPYSFDVPSWAFRHTDPNAQLEFSAKRANGSSLPEWLHFNPKTLKFSGTPPKGATDERVMVIVKDQYGNELHATFNVHVNKESVTGATQVVDPNAVSNKPTNEAPKESTEQTPAEPQAALGRFGLNEQIHAAGRLSKLQESRALLDSLKDL